MWLIENSSLTLKHFVDPPPYAILSHTWGDEEVSFQDMSNLYRARQKKGFSKIARTCRLAVAHDPPLEYSWVDTCCIDKTSSAELSEAINSMFRWYQQAKICFAYLQESSNGVGGGSDGPSPEQVLQQQVKQRHLPYPDDQFAVALTRFRWFTRGWTLQELIASRDIWFYTGAGSDHNAWRYIGRKSELVRHLSAITGVPEAVLRSDGDHWHDSLAALHTASAAQKMSWAAARQTTRVEDLAYCLLGIFDINMPMLYGEGSKAFTRLQEEILRKTGDLSLLAWRADGDDSVGESGLIQQTQPEFAGILATHPRQFRGCSTVRCQRPPIHLNDICTINHGCVGLRDAWLYYEQGQVEDEILDLHCSKVDDSAADADGSSGTADSRALDIGIHVRKTVGKYVRSVPSKLAEIYKDHVVHPESRVYLAIGLDPVLRAALLRDLDHSVSVVVPVAQPNDGSGRGKVHVRKHDVVPKDIWDDRRVCFLLQNVHRDMRVGFMQIEVAESEKSFSAGADWIVMFDVSSRADEQQPAISCCHIWRYDCDEMLWKAAMQETERAGNRQAAAFLEFTRLLRAEGKQMTLFKYQTWTVPRQMELRTSIDRHPEFPHRYELIIDVREVGTDAYGYTPV